MPAPLLRGILLAGTFALGSGCLNAPPPAQPYREADATSLQIYRVMCRRVAKDAYPDDQTGMRFYEECDSGDPNAEPDPTLRMILRYRGEILAAIARVLAEPDARSAGVSTFEEGELKAFLKALVPLYDLPRETIPTTTRAVAELLQRLVDKDDPRTVEVLDTVARLVKRLGYRQPDLNIGALRALLTYPQLEDLATKLLPVLTSKDAKLGAAHDQFLSLLNALALELADEPVAVDRTSSTLRRVLELALSEDPTQASGNVGTTLVLQRDDSGNAVGDGAAGTPFAVAGRPDNAAARDANGVALLNGQPAYQTRDVSKTRLAALFRELSGMTRRQDLAGVPIARAPLEGFLHGMQPLLGPWGPRSLAIGKNKYAYRGPDLSQSALMQFAHAASTLAKYPETITLLKALDALLQGSESDTTAILYAGLAINERSKKHDEAKLNGPHEFWDDLVATGIRGGKRPGLLEALLRSFVEDSTGSLGRLLAVWFRYADEISYPNYPSANPDDINKPVDQKYSRLADRNAPNTGFNRSIWQRLCSLLNAWNGQRVCNRKGATITAPTVIGDITFPPIGDGFDECALVEIPDAVEGYAMAMIGTLRLQLKDSVTAGLAEFGPAIGFSTPPSEILQTQTGIKDFTVTPTPQALTRVVFAPRNAWTNDLLEIPVTNYGVDAAAYEPNGLFPGELVSERTPLNGAPSSFLVIAKDLMKAFDQYELRNPNAAVGTLSLIDGYMFGNILSMLHQHWPMRSDTMCSLMLTHDSAGCTQSLDRKAPFYAAQTGMASYELLMAEAFDEEDLVWLLHNVAKSMAKVSVPGPGGQVDGIKALGDFVQRLVTVDPAIKKWTGETSTRTNLCRDDGKGGCVNGVGHMISELTPLHLVADALHAFDVVWAEQPARHDAWLQGRSGILDQLLTTDRTGAAGSYSYTLRDRTTYKLMHPLLTWLIEQMERHQQAGDAAAWAHGDASTQGLAQRLATVLSHPITAGTFDMFDAFWPETEASGAFMALLTYMMDERNSTPYRATLTSLADFLQLLESDGELSPAIQFAALGLAPNVFDAIDGKAQPNADKSVAYAAVDLVSNAVTALNDPQQNPFKQPGKPTALSKLLNNAVLTAPNERSALELTVDAIADVNRPNALATQTDPLTADEDRDIFGDVKLFLRDDKSQRSLERLYDVVQSRKVK